jgi:hypothetical protein
MKIDILIPGALSVAFIIWGIVERIYKEKPSDQLILAMIFAFIAIWRSGK